MSAPVGHAGAQDPPPPATWLRLDPLPAEMPLTSRESFDGVPPRFVLMTDGSVFVGGRREILRGSLNQAEMQAMSARLHAVFAFLGTAEPTPTLVIGDGPPIFRFSVLLGSTFQTVVTGSLPEEDAPPSTPLLDFVRSLAAFRHPTFRPFDPPHFAMVVRERTLPGGCRLARGLPPLSTSISNEQVVSEEVTRGFPTGAEMTQICEGGKRFTLVFRPLVPGDR